MSPLRRGLWTELDLRGGDDVPTLFHPGWTNDLSGLLLPLRETGWYTDSVELRLAFDTAVLTWGWVGVDDDLNVVLCSSGGEVIETGEMVGDVAQVTVARFPKRDRD